MFHLNLRIIRHYIPEDRTWYVFEIGGSHGGDHEDYCLIEYDAA
jgi:hypothetical protein